MINIDHFIVYLYLLLMLGFGVWAGRGVKDMKDYAVANQTYPSAIIMLTLLATILGGGSTLGIVETIHANGIIMLVPHIGTVISYIIIAKYIAPKVVSHTGMISIGDMMMSFFGPKGRYLTGFMGFLYCTGILAAQCKAIGYVLNSTFGFSEEFAILLGASVFVIYATFGGIRSVTITDVFQFGILIIMIPLVANIVVMKLGGMESFLSQIPSNKFEVFRHPAFWEVFVMLMVFGVFPTFMLSPATIQRMLMTKDKKSVSKIFYAGALLQIPFDAMILLIALAAIILFPDINHGLAMPMVITETLPPVLTGLAVAGILAVVMSTADSALNSGAILFTHDFVKSFKPLTNSQELTITKMVSVIMGIGAVTMALYAKGVLSLLFYIYSLWGPLIVIPFIYCVLGYKSSEKAFIYSLAITSLCFVFTQVLLSEEQKFWSGLICLVLNFFCFTFFSCRTTGSYPPFLSLATYIYNKVFAFNLRTLIKPSAQKRAQTSILLKIDNSVEKIRADTISFAIFCCLSYIVPYFMWTHKAVPHYEYMIAIRLICGILCVGLLLKSLWPSKSKKFFNLYWYFTLCFCLPFHTILMAYINNFDMEWMVNISLSIFLLALLVDWLSFIALSSIGISLGYIQYLAINPNSTLSLGYEQTYLVVYIFIFSTIIGLFFSRKREVIADDRLEYIKRKASMIAHDLKTPLAGISGISEILMDMIHNSNKNFKDDKIFVELTPESYEMLLQTPVQINNSTEKGLKFIEHLLITSSANVPKNDLKFLSLNECVEEAIRTLNLIHNHNISIKYHLKNDVCFYSTKQFVVHMILNILCNSVKHGGSNINIEITLNNNELSIIDDGVGIAPEILTKIFSNRYSGIQSTGIGLNFCHIVMESIGGKIKCDSQLGKYTKFTLIFPT